MSKAEKAAIEHGYKNGSYPEYSADTVRQAFISGYHQAEKDNELTWEDMREIYFLFKAVRNEWYGNEFSDYGICREVLKRFKAQKGEEV